jgi:hypothetical protein
MMTTTSVRPPAVFRLFPIAALVAGLGMSPAAAAPPPLTTPIRATLLPVPPVTAGQTVAVSVADVTPAGDVVGGTISTITRAPDGTQLSTGTAQRWRRTPAGWRRQQLAQPAGTRFTSVAGLTDLGAAAGSLTDAAGRSRAVRWTPDGRRIVSLAESNSSVTAVGPHGPWAVHLSEPGAIPGDSELVDGQGRRTPMRGTPELDAGYDRTVLSVAGPRTALVGVHDGVGFGGTVTPVLYRNGATLALPVAFRVLQGATCLTPVQPDGSLVYSGVRFVDGVPEGLLVRHVGGVPGRDVPLAAAGTIDTPTAGLGCDSNGVSDRLAADSGVAGVWQEPVTGGWTSQAAYWDGRGRPTVVPLRPGEESAVAVAVATGARMVIRVQTGAGPQLALCSPGNRRALTLPSGWTPGPVVELTDTGTVVGLASDAAGATRAVVWETSGR